MDDQFWIQEDTYNFYKAVEDINRGCDLHYHSNCEMLCLLSGSHRMMVNGEVKALTAGDICFVNSFDSHIFFPSPDQGKLILLTFSREYFANFEKQYGNKVLDNFLTDKSANAQIFETVVFFLKQHRSFSSFLVQGYFDVILGLLSRHYGVREVSTTISVMREVLQYIHQHYREKITRGELAALIGYNENYFSQLFIKSVGVSFVDYANMLRCKRVQRALVEKDKKDTILKIVTEEGFDSVSSYYRALEKQKNGPLNM